VNGKEKERSKKEKEKIIVENNVYWMLLNMSYGVLSFFGWVVR